MNSAKDSLILVAEDHPVNQTVMKLMLESLSHDCVVVVNGFEAVKAARERNFALILMDIMMPDMDGFQASLEIRKFEFKIGRHTPIIACTAMSETTFFDEAVRCGIDGYLPKPISKSSLKSILDHWIRPEWSNLQPPGQTWSGRQLP